MVVDKRTKYPDVEMVYSTAFASTKETLKKIFATYGTPIQLETDNGPPFNSKDFSEFAIEEGFKHHRITPLHPRANGEAESFMKMVNKTEQRAHAQKVSIKIAMQEMLTGYRSTPHPATGITPYEGMMNRQVRTKLDHHPGTLEKSYDDLYVNEKDRRYKRKAKENAENRNTKEHSFEVNDYVLLQQPKVNKWSTIYEPVPYIIYKVCGSTISARRITDGREICRNSSYFKRVDRPIQRSHQTSNVTTNEIMTEDRRGSILRRSKVYNENDTSIRGDSEPSGQDNAPDEGELQQQDQPQPDVEERAENPADPVGRPQRQRRLPMRLNDYILY